MDFIQQFGCHFMCGVVADDVCCCVFGKAMKVSVLGMSLGPGAGLGCNHVNGFCRINRVSFSALQGPPFPGTLCNGRNTTSQQQKKIKQWSFAESGLRKTSSRLKNMRG